jgi:hypothetical protein
VRADRSAGILAVETGLSADVFGYINGDAATGGGKTFWNLNGENWMDDNRTNSMYFFSVGSLVGVL